MPKDPKTIIRESCSGNNPQGIYEQYSEKQGKNGFLVFRKSTILNAFYEKTGDWKTFFTYYDSFEDEGPEGEPIKIVPMKRTIWPLPDGLPEIMLPDNELWDELRSFISDNLALVDEYQYDILVAWIKATYISERFNAIPYLIFLGPSGSGKTRALDVLRSLCYHAMMSPNASGAVIYNAVEKWKPTLLLDESEIYTNENKEDIVGLLNAGYKRGQYALRMKKGKDETQEVAAYDVFGFKALAGIDGHKVTIMSRGILINMFKANRKVGFLIDEARAKALRTQLILWRMMNIYDLFNKKDDDNDSNDAYDASRNDNLNMLEEFEDGRFTEKYYPLVSVCGEYKKKEILVYARNARLTEQMESEASIEAELTEAIYHSMNMADNYKIATKIIADQFNSDRVDKEKWKTESVGRVIRRLGFHSSRGANGLRCFLIDENTLNYNLKRYGVIADKKPLSLLEASQASPLSLLPENIESVNGGKDVG